MHEEEKVTLTLEEFKKSWMGLDNAPAIFISALHKENIDEFKQLLYDRVHAMHTQRYPYDKLLY
jgi:GTP-binding protein HflX